MAKNPIIYVDSRALVDVSLMMASNSSNNSSFGQEEIEEINIHLVGFEVGFMRRSAHWRHTLLHSIKRSIVFSRPGQKTFETTEAHVSLIYMQSYF